MSVLSLKTPPVRVVQDTESCSTHRKPTVFKAFSVIYLLILHNNAIIFLILQGIGVCYMATEVIHVRVDTKLVARMKELVEFESKSKKKSISQAKIVNEALKMYLDQEEAQVIDSIYAPLLSRVFAQYSGQLEKRMMGLLAKSSTDSARLLYIVLEMYAKESGKSTADIFERASKFAVRHVKEREIHFEDIERSLKGNE